MRPAISRALYCWGWRGATVAWLAPVDYADAGEAEATYGQRRGMAMMAGRSRVGDATGDAVGTPIGAPLTTRVWRRAQARLATRGQRRRRWRSRGQTLIFFALSVTVLVAILGLAIDTIRIYDLYARMQRAAEAGALAAVLYMPNNYTTPLAIPPADTAVCRALQEVIKDGFGQPCGANLSGYCPANPASIEVAICPVSGKPHD